MKEVAFFCATAAQVEDISQVARFFPGRITLVVLSKGAKSSALSASAEPRLAVVDLSSALADWLHKIIVSYRGRRLIRAMTRRRPFPIFMLGGDLNPPEVAFVKAIKRRRAVSVLLQDGLLDSRDPQRIVEGPSRRAKGGLWLLGLAGVVEPVNPFYGAIGSDQVFVYGAATRELLVRQGVPQDKITITGAPRLDRLFEPLARGHHRPAARRRYILCLGLMLAGRGWANAEADRRWIFAANAMADQRPDWTVILRPHPADDSRLYAERFAELPSLALRLETETPIHRALEECDAVVMNFPSSVLLEAVVIGRPVLFLDLGLGCQRNDYQSDSAVRSVSNLDCLADEVESVLAGGEEKFEETRRRFIERHLGFSDGRSGQRVAKLLERLCVTNR